jgi:hypothetical protein
MWSSKLEPGLDRAFARGREDQLVREEEIIYGTIAFHLFPDPLDVLQHIVLLGTHNKGDEMVRSGCWRAVVPLA